MVEAVVKVWYENLGIKPFGFAIVVGDFWLEEKLIVLLYPEFRDENDCHEVSSGDKVEFSSILAYKGGIACGWRMVKK